VVIGYARVSTQEQNLDRQIDILSDEKCEKIFQEKVSANDKERPELENLLEFSRAGDTVIVTELTRLSRSTKSLLYLIDRFMQKGVNFKSLKESWIDTTSAHGRLVLNIFAGLVQFENDLLRERVKEGLKAAKKRGKPGGRLPKNEKAINFALKLHDSNEYSISEICKMAGLSNGTLYKYLKLRKQEQENKAS